jgi:hypothetical protein
MPVDSAVQFEGRLLRLGRRVRVLLLYGGPEGGVG